MFTSFQLSAVVRTGNGTRLLRIPMHQTLQETLRESWYAQYEAFTDGMEEIDFDAGYNPEEQERFRVANFERPDWLVDEDSTTIAQLEPIDQHEDELDSIRAIAAFARLDGNELILFQNFVRSHVIQPGRFLFLHGGTYVTQERPGLSLDSKIAAIYYSQHNKLLFRSFRATNTFLPLDSLYREASEGEIREILTHNLLAPADAETTASHSQTQWFRKRFAMLRDSGILDKYTAEEIVGHSQGYGITIEANDGRIVFPADRPGAKRLLQFLNEEVFRGAITETLYETNSKREAN